MQSFVENPHVSTRRAAEDEISQFLVRKVLKQNKFHPYKIHLAQKLNEDDFDR